MICPDRVNVAQIFQQVFSILFRRQAWPHLPFFVPQIIFNIRFRKKQMMRTNLKYKCILHM